jgi:hypothetical protein
MKTKLLGIMIILLGLVAIFVILYLTIFNKYFSVSKIPIPLIGKEETAENKADFFQEEDRLASPDKQGGQAEININTHPPKTEEMITDNLERIALSFSERYGSYSNQSNFSNMTDLKIFMTKDMKVWIDKFVADSIGKGVSEIYYGITTKAVTAEIINFDDAAGKAEVLVNAIRSEATGATDNANSFNQDISVQFLKENGAWKVDKAVWQ